MELKSPQSSKKAKTEITPSKSIMKSKSDENEDINNNVDKEGGDDNQKEDDGKAKLPELIKIRRSMSPSVSYLPSLKLNFTDSTFPIFHILLVI